MEESFDYKILFNQALQLIRSVRDPRANKPEAHDLGWDILKKQVMFDFGGKEFSDYTNVIGSAKNISISCLRAIILLLCKQNNVKLEPVEAHFECEDYSKVLFCFKDYNDNSLLLFKEIEECSLWKMEDIEPADIQKILDENRASSCKYIYLVFDYAYLQIVGHNDDGTDPGRGYNVYSIKWFFENYFGEYEYGRFLSSVQEYCSEVNNYLGYIFIKSLTPNALISFRRVVENEIIKFDYSQLLKRVIQKRKAYLLPEVDFNIIEAQYLYDKVFQIALGNHDFAESLITAEWLINSMEKAKAIDLTVIGMGYFKAVEQLLFDLICLHKNENRLIKKDYSRKDLNDKIPLNEHNIKDEAVDSTIGSMANFFKDNLDILLPRLSCAAKEYIREKIFDFKDLRNGYFHKNNIHSLEKIKEIRNETFLIIFLLLGSHSLSGENKTSLGMPAIENFNDYARLCEYVNYHANEVFFINIDGEQETILLACSDLNSKVIDESYVKYSGAYFKNLGKNSRQYIFKEDCLPNEVYLGKFVFAQSKEIKINPVKVKKIFAEGRFVGPSITEEENLSY